MEYNLYKLKNGVRVLEVPVAEAPSVTSLILFGVGSRYETKEINGLSHFLEHMFFKGTKNRPSAEMIAEEVDSIGGEMNAFTSKEYTGYYIKAAGKHGKLTLDVLSDMLQNPLFQEEEINRERGVITEEIKMYEDQPMLYVGELFENHLFGDTPLGWDTIGTRENIASVQREQFMQYRNNFYTADNMVVVLAGDLSQVKPYVKQYFESVGGSKAGTFKKLDQPPKRSPYKMYVKKTEQTHVWVGFKGMAANDPDRFALRIISAILGGGMSSRLFLSVRERKGLAYYVRASAEHYMDTGYLVAMAGVGTDKFTEAMEAILLELKRIRDEKVQDKELKKAKEYLKGKLLLRVEQSDNLAELLGMQEILQQAVMTPEELNKQIDMVTADDVARVAKAVMTNERLCAAIISAEDYSKWLDKNLRV